MPPLKPAASHTATKLAAPRITGAPRPGHPDFTIRTPISPPELHLAPPAAPGAGGSGSQSARPRSPPPQHAHGRAEPRGSPRAAHAHARCRGRAALRGSTGTQRGGRGRGAATRWRRRLANAGGAGSCQKSRSQIGSFFSPQGQGFGPSPSCHRRERTHLPAAVPASQGLGSPAAIFRRGLQRCAGIILLFLLLAPAPLQNLSLTLRKHLEEGWIPGMPAPR